jgi:hypothetical protein
MEFNEIKKYFLFSSCYEYTRVHGERDSSPLRGHADVALYGFIL